MDRELAYIKVASQLIKHTIFQPLGLPLRYASGRMDTHLIIFQKSSVASINSFWHVLSDIILQYGHLISSVIPSILPSLLHIAYSSLLHLLLYVPSLGFLIVHSQMINDWLTDIVFWSACLCSGDIYCHCHTCFSCFCWWFSIVEIMFV